MNRHLIVSIILALLYFSPPSSAQPAQSAPETIRIAVASNFKTTLEGLVAVWQNTQPERHTTHISISSASTGILYNQITRGAPFDIFMSADEAHPLLLEDTFTPNKSDVYAIGRLVYWFPKQAQHPQQYPDQSASNAKKRLKALILHESNQKMALANPKLAPYGNAAHTTLVKLALVDKLADKIVTGNNIAQVFQFVYSGAASSGFVALSQIKQGSVDQQQWLEVPSTEYNPIMQRMILLNSSTRAKAVYRFLKSRESRQFIAKNGYALPKVRSGIKN